jgi:hypothetical protein
MFLSSGRCARDKDQLFVVCLSVLRRLEWRKTMPSTILFITARSASDNSFSVMSVLLGFRTIGQHFVDDRPRDLDQPVVAVVDPDLHQRVPWSITSITRSTSASRRTI